MTHERPDRIVVPISEQNPPDDRSIGWKDFTVSQINGDPNRKVTVQRWWTGSQWGDTYKDKEDSNAEARSDSKTTDFLQSHGAKEGVTQLLRDTSLSSRRTESQGFVQTTSQEQDGSKDSSGAESSKVIRSLVDQIHFDKSTGLTVSEIAEKHALPETEVRKVLFPENTSNYGTLPEFIQHAKQFVVGAYAVETAESGEPELTVDQLYLVTFTFILGNWKAMLSTNVPGDGLYFEVTFSYEKEETYVDIYKKQANHVFSHHDH